MHLAIDPDLPLSDHVLADVSIALLIAVVAAIVLAITATEASRYRDPQRLFTSAEKKIILARAQWRCEHKHPFWKRCQATTGLQADHIVPWSRSGRTILANAQALCAGHNRTKSNHMPRTIYIWRLNRRRRKY